VLQSCCSATLPFLSFEGTDARRLLASLGLVASLIVVGVTVVYAIRIEEPHDRWRAFGTTVVGRDYFALHLVQR